MRSKVRCIVNETPVANTNEIRKPVMKAPAPSCVRTRNNCMISCCASPRSPIVSDKQRHVAHVQGARDRRHRNEERRGAQDVLCGERQGVHAEFEFVRLAMNPTDPRGGPPIGEGL